MPDAQSGQSAEKSPRNAPLEDIRSIELDVHGELAFWLKVFNTTKDELLAAISAVGAYAGPVKRYLQSKDANSAQEGAGE